jgi:hypothetical protein
MGWGSGIRDLEKLYPGSRIRGFRGQKNTESQISIHNTKFLHHKWLLKIYGMSRSQKPYCEEMQKLLEAEYDFVDCEG